MPKQKIAKPSGLLIKCPHCGGDNEIEESNLMENDFPCQYSQCDKMFATCAPEDFYKYLGLPD